MLTPEQNRCNPRRNPGILPRPWFIPSADPGPSLFVLKKDEGRSPGFEACALLAPFSVFYATCGKPFFYQSSGAERRLLTCCGDTGVPWLPHDIRMYVTTAATSVSDSACANGGMPYGRGLPPVLGG